jgi:hypothetical protein
VDIKNLVCLANSWKHDDLCVAGLEITDAGVGDWIRPVSSRPGHGISTGEQTLNDGSLPATLDVIQVGVIRHTPMDYQTENWLVDPSYRWRRVGRWTHSDAAAALDRPSSLWSNTLSSSVGVHDRVSVADLSAFSISIVLVEVDDPTVVVAKNPYSEKTEVRLAFAYNGVRHKLKITDPSYHGMYLGQGHGQYGLVPKTLITVSLAEPWSARGSSEAYSYKVVAAIIEP